MKQTKKMTAFGDIGPVDKKPPKGLSKSALEKQCQELARRNAALIVELRVLKMRHTAAKKLAKELLRMPEAEYSHELCELVLGEQS